jgi:hypothetical protein
MKIIIARLAVSTKDVQSPRMAPLAAFLSNRGPRSSLPHVLPTGETKLRFNAKTLLHLSGKRIHSIIKNAHD